MIMSSRTLEGKSIDLLGTKKFMSLTMRQISLAIALCVGSSFAADRVTGANATLDIVAGAKSAALGGTVLAQNEDLMSVDLNSYQLAEQQYVWGSFSHVAYFEGTVYDYASMTLPLGDGHALGIAFSRFGADDIPWIKEGEEIPEGSNYRTLSIADYVFSVAYGRQIFRNLDLGVSLHGLYRELDQSGWGFRGDATLRYMFPENVSVAALLKGWTSSGAKWESGEFEYESPELYLAASWGVPVRYFYGSLNLYWQSAGLFHHEARDLDWDGSDRGGRLWDDPLDWLQGGRGGLEFAFDFGLSLRAGLASFTEFESFTAGAGLTLAKFLKVDYAFESHPVLSAVHRVSVSISPWLFFKPEREKKARLYAPVATPTTAQEEPEEVQEEASGITFEEEASAPVYEEQAETSEPVKEGAAVEPAVQTEEETLEYGGGMQWEE